MKFNDINIMAHQKFKKKITHKIKILVLSVTHTIHIHDKISSLDYSIAPISKLHTRILILFERIAGVDLGMLKGRGTQCAGPQEAIYLWYGHCRRQCIEVRSADPSAQSMEIFFHIHFSVVWIGSRSTFVLCTALLTGRLSLTDVLELAIASYQTID